MISELKKILLEDNIYKNTKKSNLDKSIIKLNQNKFVSKCPNCNRCEYILNKKILPYCNLDCFTNDKFFGLNKK